MKRNIWAILMALVMVLSMASVAFAEEDYVAQIGEQGYTTLQAAIDAAQNGNTITLLTDCDETVTIKQQKNLSFVIDGDDKNYTGTIYVDGNKRSIGAETLTIKNVNFVMGGIYGIAAHTTKSTFPHNLTVENCTFTGEGDAYKKCYGIYLRHAYNITVKDVEGTGLFDLVYGNTAVTGFTAEDITVTDSTNGIWLAYVNTTANFDNIEMDVDDTGLGFFNNASGTVTIDNASINADAAAVALVQKSATVTGKVDVIIEKLEGEAPVMVDIESVDDEDDFNVTMNDVTLEENADGDYVYKKPVYISNVEELVAFRNAVNNGNDFAGVTVYLTADIDLEGYTEFNVNYQGNNVEAPTFRPIGEDTPFRGTFDGQNYTISNMYQSGWDIGYQWGVYGSLGLFAEIEDATIKNLTIDGFEAQVEGGDVAAITGSATGTCVFENITISDTKLGTYNNGCGSIIAWSGAGDYTFKDITIEDDVVLGGLWGSFDSSIGGVVGQAEPGASYTFENVDIACRIDAYNDCTASYDYYNYRMCGMIIGRLEETQTIGGTNYPNTEAYEISFEDVNITIGDWYDYHYCEPTPADMNGGRGMRVEPGYAYDGLPEDYDHSQCTTNHYAVIRFEQLLGGAQLGVKGMPYDKLPDDLKAGVTVNYPPAEAKIGDTEYKTLQEAATAAAEGDTIEILTELCELCGPASVAGKDIKLTAAEGVVVKADKMEDLFAIADGASVSVIGGTYTFDPTEDTAAGYKAYDLQNGTWVVKSVDAKVTVTFETNGGSSVDSKTIGFANTVTPDSVTRAGYKFAGWYTDAEFTTPFDFDTPITKDTTLYANWTKKSSGGGSSSLSYQIVIDDMDNGDVTASSKSAKRNATVTLTVSADEGYELDELTVTDSKGNEITVKEKSNGKYTFTMPSSKVTVDATFVAEDQDDTANTDFVDVDDKAYYADAVKWAVEKDVTTGTGKNTFGPGEITTRAQTVTFLWRAMGSPEPKTTVCPFKDVTESAYYYDAVLWAVENGITEGTSATEFSPNETVTRAQTVTFLWRMAGKPEVTAAGAFADVAADAYYYQAVEWAVAEEITSGTSATTFSPAAACARAQIVTFLYNYMGK